MFKVLFLKKYLYETNTTSKYPDSYWVCEFYVTNKTKVISLESAGFADSNIRYANDVFPQTTLRVSDTLIEWKGEKVHTQILLLANEEVSKLKVSVSDLMSEEKGKISTLAFYAIS